MPRCTPSARSDRASVASSAIRAAAPARCASSTSGFAAATSRTASPAGTISTEAICTAALAAVQIASVLIVPAGDAVLDVAAAKPLVELAQRAGAAALIADDATLARSLRADGVHLGISFDPAGAYAEARK